MCVMERDPVSLGKLGNGWLLLARSTPACQHLCRHSVAGAGGHLQLSHPPIASTEVQALSTRRCEGTTPQILSIAVFTDKSTNEPFPGRFLFPQSQGSGVDDGRPFSCPLWVPPPPLWDTVVSRARPQRAKANVRGLGPEGVFKSGRGLLLYPPYAYRKTKTGSVKRWHVDICFSVIILCYIIINPPRFKSTRGKAAY